MSSQVNGVTPLNQIRLTNVAYVRLKKGNQIYEVAAYRNKVVNWRNKIETDLNEVLQVQDVFTNVARGLSASKNDLLRGFDSTDKEAICKEILEKGDFQVTELERKTLTEGMYRDVASIVVEKSYNTDTGRAYSLSMVQNAMKDIHFSVNLSKGAKQQALEVIRKLKQVMPIARVKLSLRITTPSAHASQIEEMLLNNAAEIVKGASAATSLSTADAVSKTVIEVNINPESFRAIEDATTSLTQGQGILEITHQQQAVAPGAKGEQEQEQDEERVEEDRVHLVGNENKELGTKKGKSKASATKEDLGNDGDEVVFFMAKSGKGNSKKKKEKKKMARQQQQMLDEEDGDISEEDGEDDESAASSLRRLDINSSSGAAAPTKEGKKSKKNKRREKEIQKELNKKEQERADRQSALGAERAASSALQLQLEGEGALAPVSVGAFKCNTCGPGAHFATSLEHRAHFKSDWHRINLKRKLMKLPLVMSEEEFYAKHIDHWDCDIDSCNT